MNRLLCATPIALDADSYTASLMREMLPSAREAGRSGTAGIVRTMRSASAAPPPPQAPPSIRVSGVAFWIDAPSPGRVIFRNAGGSVHGAIDRAASRAEVRVSARIAEHERMDPGIAFGVVVSLLAARLGHALVHGAGVIAPDGRAWLLAGDSRSGKSTTTATLVAGGWDYLSDDAVILSPRRAASPDAGVRVEGWRVPIRLDAGWPSRLPAADRAEIDPVAFGGGQWRATAPLGGIVLPRVDRSARTALAAVSPAEAFTALVRQSPWLMTDPVAAPRLTELLSRVSAYPAARLMLGDDSYANAERITNVLAPLTAD